MILVDGKWPLNLGLKIPLKTRFLFFFRISNQDTPIYVVDLILFLNFSLLLVTYLVFLLIGVSRNSPSFGVDITTDVEQVVLYYLVFPTLVLISSNYTKSLVKKGVSSLI